jgi:Asp-tRNA(Asn)/Glu-tRNA(Gln) amidotransferase C subunit
VDTVDPQLVEELARAARIEVPAEDRELLTTMLQNQLDAIRLVQQVDVDGVEPIVSFDPRWR